MVLRLLEFEFHLKLLTLFYPETALAYENSLYFCFLKSDNRIYNTVIQITFFRWLLASVFD